MLFVLCAQHAYVRLKCVSRVLLQRKIARGPIAGCRGCLYIYLRAAFYNLSLLTTQPLSLIFNVFKVIKTSVCLIKSPLAMQIPQ